MTAAALTTQQTNFKPVQILLLAILLAAVVLSIHAVTRHGTDAITAAQCADRPELRMINPETGRVALICWTDRGWGIYIQTADGKNVTAFVKNKMRALSDVIRYMHNAGYRIIQ